MNQEKKIAYPMKRNLKYNQITYYLVESQILFSLNNSIISMRHVT